MTLFLFAASMAVLALGATASLIVGSRRFKISKIFGVGSAFVGGLLAAAACGYALLSGLGFDINLAWSIPWGSLHLAIDGLSAFFGMVIGVVASLAAIYGGSYLSGHSDGHNTHNNGVCWFFYNILLASMLMVVTARNGVLFLIAWEIMTLASFFLVIFEHDRPGVLRAGWIYLVAAHLATAFLLALFVTLGVRCGSLDFADFAAKAASEPTALLFILAIVGFGAKAGFLPLHVWLPEAHPAAPSHVSAVMSGVMIKTGIYGLLRMIIFLGPPPVWWGWLLIIIGAASGLTGVIFAIAQRDIKRVLAYSSVENMGIICLGLGMGLLGLSLNNPVLATLGLLGGLMHIANHAIFKTLLFLGAGAVAKATGTREIDRLGGLAHCMPKTAATFFIAAAAICGLPPLNGFVGEFLIFSGAYTSLSNWGGAIQLAAAGVTIILSLGLIGGLAAVCFTQTFGVVFLGSPRTPQAKAADESPKTMLTIMITLAVLCLIIGLTAPLAIHAIIPAAKIIAPSIFESTAQINDTLDTLNKITIGSALILGISFILAIIRLALLKNRDVKTQITWDCGYADPTAKMQYTGSSFSLPTLRLVAWLTRPIEKFRFPTGLFPRHASIDSNTEDVFERFGYRRIFAFVDHLAGKLHWLQAGRIQLYVLYIVLTLLILLVWKLGVIIR